MDEKTRLQDEVDMVPGNFSTWRLCDVNTNEGEWNLDLIYNVLSNNVVQDIIRIHPPSMENGNDVCLWLGDRLGRIDVAETYHLLVGHQLNENAPNWKKTWKLDFMEKWHLK